MILPGGGRVHPCLSNRSLGYDRSEIAAFAKEKMI